MKIIIQDGPKRTFKKVKFFFHNGGDSPLIIRLKGKKKKTIVTTRGDQIDAFSRSFHKQSFAAFSPGQVYVDDSWKSRSQEESGSSYDSPTGPGDPTPPTVQHELGDPRP